MKQNADKLKELEGLSVPIVEFLKQQPHPHHTVLITEQGVTLLETKLFVPTKEVK